MKQIFDENSANDAYRERQHEEQGQRELKNRILAMQPGPRKTARWQQHFPVYNFTGEIIDSPVY